MDRFPTQQTFDRSHAPAVGAPADGLAPGTVYTAVIQSVIVEGMVAITIPALHLSQTFQAHIKPDSNCAGGETCLVELDEFKIPWVITGSWSSPDSGWVILAALLNSWANQGGSRLTVAYRRQGNEVRLRGSVLGGASGAIVFTLPEGYRPTAEVFAAGAGFPGGVGVAISASGNVSIFFPAGNSQASLDGVSFTID